MNTGSTTFAKAIKLERNRLELTQTQLADAVGTTQQNVAGWERGKSLPKTPTWERLVELFGKDSIIAALPPRGEIPGGNEIMYSNRAILTAQTQAEYSHLKALPQPTPAPAQAPCEPHVAMLAAMFATLPDDPMVRALALGECARCIRNALENKDGVAPSQQSEQ